MIAIRGGGHWAFTCHIDGLACDVATTVYFLEHSIESWRAEREGLSFARRRECQQVVSQRHNWPRLLLDVRE